MHTLLLASLGLLELAGPTSGVPTAHGFVHGTEDGRLVVTSRGAKETFEARVHERAVYAWAAQGDTLVALDELGGVLLHDLASRRLVARVPAPVPGDGALPPVLTAKQVYLEGSNGQWVAHSTARGQLLFRVEALGLAGDGAELLYATRGRELASLAPRTGRPLWIHALPGPPFGSPTVDADGVVAVFAEPVPRKRGAVSHVVAEWTHAAGAQPRWRRLLPRAPRGSPLLCGPGVGLLVEPEKPGAPLDFLRLDRLDGRRVGVVPVPEDSRLRCAGDLFVLTHPRPTGGTRVLVAAPTGELLWERGDLSAFVGRDQASFLVATEDATLLEVSAETGAAGARGRVELTVEQTPRPEGQALQRYLRDGEELQLGTKDTSSLRLRVFRGGVLEPSVMVSAEDESSLPPGLRLSRDGLLFGRARGRGLYAVPLAIATPGRPPLALNLALRLVP